MTQYNPPFARGQKIVIGFLCCVVALLLKYLPTKVKLAYEAYSDYFRGGPEKTFCIELLASICP